MSTEKENIRRRFADFFIAKQKLSILGKEIFQANRPKGWFEEIRTKAFGSPNFGDMVLKEGPTWTGISAKVYNIHAIGPLSVILAYYDDGTVIWLDDHFSDDDFKLFVKKEHLWTWLPERKEDLIALLIETKLNYLGRPQLINTISEIPSFSIKEMESWLVDPHAQNQLVEAQQKLKHVSEKIIPPILLVEPNGIFELTLFVWTKIMGKLVHVRFKFGQDGLFLFEGDELVKMVGRFIVPR